LGGGRGGKTWFHRVEPPGAACNFQGGGKKRPPTINRRTGREGIYRKVSKKLAQPHNRRVLLCQVKKLLGYEKKRKELRAKEERGKDW